MARPPLQFKPQEPLPVSSRWHVAVDGDWALVQVDQFVPDPNAETGTRHDGGALLFRKVNNTWSYIGILGAVGTVDEWTTPGLAMKNGIAMVIEKSVRVFERSGSTWTQAPINIPPGTALQGPDIEIDGGRILVPRVSCNRESAVYSKVGTTWTVEGVLTGHMSYCNDNAPSAFHDLAGSRAIVFNMPAMNNDPPTMRMYRPSTTGSCLRARSLSQRTRRLRISTIGSRINRDVRDRKLLTSSAPGARPQ